MTGPISRAKKKYRPFWLLFFCAEIKSKFTWHDVGMTVGADKQDRGLRALRGIGVEGFRV